MGFAVWGAWFGVRGSGLGVRAGCWAWSLRFRFWCSFVLAFGVNLISRDSFSVLLQKLPQLRHLRRYVDVRLPGKEIKLPWREAGSPSHLDDQVDSDQ